MKTLYGILGVDEEASSERIKSAYRRLAMQWHPDRNPGRAAEAERRFKEIVEAYETLSDADARRRYDESLRGHAAPPPRPARNADPQAFAESMSRLAQALRREGFSRERVLAALVSQGCPQEAAEAIVEGVFGSGERRERRAESDADPAAAVPEARPPDATAATFATDRATPTRRSRHDAIGAAFGHRGVLLWALAGMVAAGVVVAAVVVSAPAPPGPGADPRPHPGSAAVSVFDAASGAGTPGPR